MDTLPEYRQRNGQSMSVPLLIRLRVSIQESRPLPKPIIIKVGKQNIHPFGSESPHSLWVLLDRATVVYQSLGTTNPKYCSEADFRMDRQSSIRIRLSAWRGAHRHLPVYREEEVYETGHTRPPRLPPPHRCVAGPLREDNDSTFEETKS